MHATSQSSKIWISLAVCGIKFEKCNKNPIADQREDPVFERKNYLLDTGSLSMERPLDWQRLSTLES